MTLALLVVAACTAKVPPHNPLDPPHLPSPYAGTYAPNPGRPIDPTVGAAVGAYAHDGTLAGAAAGLALAAIRGEGNLDGWVVREAAWRAGWPWPIIDVGAWSVTQGGTPAPLATWLAALPEGTSVGVVRARGSQGDAWVALAGRSQVHLDLMPRQARSGSSLTLPVVDGGTYAVSDPDGRLWEGGLDAPQPFSLVAPGEWLFEIRKAGVTEALFPIYVGMIPPELGLLGTAQPSAEPIGRAAELLDGIRDAYGAAPWIRDPLLDSGARALLAKTGDVASLAAALGFDPDEAAKWECRGSTVESCLDRILWDPRSRPALLGDSRRVGYAAEVDANGLHLVTFIAGR